MAETCSKVTKRLQEKIFKPYNYVEGLGESKTFDNSSSHQQLLSLYDGLDLNFNAFYELKTNFDFNNEEALSND